MAPFNDFLGNSIEVTPAVSQKIVAKLTLKERAQIKADIEAADIVDALQTTEPNMANAAETEKLAREANLDASKMPQADVARACYYSVAPQDQELLRQRFRYKLENGKYVVDAYDKEGKFVVTSHGIINTTSLKGTDSFVMSPQYNSDATNKGSAKVQNMEARWKHQFMDGKVGEECALQPRVLQAAGLAGKNITAGSPEDFERLFALCDDITNNSGGESAGKGSQIARQMLGMTGCIWTNTKTSSGDARHYTLEPDNCFRYAVGIDYLNMSVVGLENLQQAA